MIADVLQITCPVNPGDPGGLLANARGEAVGIVASTYERSLFDPEALGRIYRDVVRFGEGIFGKPPDDQRRAAAVDESRFAGAAGPFGGQGIGFAIPIDQVREVVDRLRAGPLADRAYLGIQVVAIEEPQGGVAVVGVREGSPAEKAGLQQWDVVLRYDGHGVATLRDFKRLVLDTPIGRSVELEVLRGESRLSVKAVLERRPRKP
jgi:S1-C subfamily serine protease